MKKFLKLFICLLTLVVGIGLAVANPAINVVNAIEQLASSLSITNSKGEFAFQAVNMPSKVNADNGEKFFIPFPTVSDETATIKINVKAGKTVYSYTIGATSQDNELFEEVTGGVNFKYTASVTYSVYFTAEKEGKTYASSMYNVDVKGVAYTLDTENVAIPDYIGNGDKIKLPTIDVKDASGEVKETIIPKLYKNNVEVEGTDGELSLVGDNYYLIPSISGNTTYTVKYESSAEYNLTKNYVVSASTAYKASEVVLEASTLSMSTIEIGKDITFPTASVSDTKHNKTNVATTTIIKIYEGDHANESLTGTPYATLTRDTYEYKFTKVGTYTVRYTISNFFVDNEKTITKDLVVTVKDTKAPVVSFAKNYDTTVAGWEDGVVILGNYAVPTKVGFDGVTLPAIYAKDNGVSYENLTFKRTLVRGNETYDIDKAEDNASIAEDNEDLTKSIQFTFKKKNENISDEQFKSDITTGGAWTLVYSAEDGINTVAKLQVSITFLSVDAVAYTDNTHLTIPELPTIASNGFKSSDEKTITVSNPSDDNEKDADRIETHYYFYYGEQSAFKTAYDTAKGAAEVVTGFFGEGKFYETFNNTNKLYELNCKDNKLTIKLDEYVDQTKFTVVGVAINDQGQYVYTAQEVEILNVTTDTTAPTVDATTLAFDKASYVLGTDERVELPEVIFNDTNAKRLSIDVNYYIDSVSNGTHKVSGYYLADTASTVQVKAGYIEPSEAGVYYVVYTARDDANNSYDFVTTFEVTKATSKYVKVEYTKSVKVGEETEIRAYLVEGETKTLLSNSDIRFTGKRPSSKGSVYTFDEADSYTFTVNATDAENAGDVYTITVSNPSYVWVQGDLTRISDNLKAPVKVSPVEYEKLTSATQPSDWETGSYYSYNATTKEYELVDGSNTTYVASSFYKKNKLEYVVIELPKATYGEKTEIADVKVTFDGNDVELIDVDMSHKKFVASKQGKYSVVFSVGTGDGKITSSAYTVSVGDTNTPTVVVSDKTSVEENLVYAGKDIKLKLSYEKNTAKSDASKNVYNVTLEATSDGKTLRKPTIEVVLYDSDMNSSQIALEWNKDTIKTLTLNEIELDSDNTWTISSVGDYTISIVVKDNYGNISQEETIKFKVVEEEASVTKKDNKVGIILIVVSIIVLAGIICFFAFSGKTASPKAKKVKEEKKEDNNEDENK